VKLNIVRRKKSRKESKKDLEKSEIKDINKLNIEICKNQDLNFKIIPTLKEKIDIVKDEKEVIKIDKDSITNELENNKNLPSKENIMNWESPIEHKEKPLEIIKNNNFTFEIINEKKIDEDKKSKEELLTEKGSNIQLELCKNEELIFEIVQKEIDTKEIKKEKESEKEGISKIDKDISTKKLGKIENNDLFEEEIITIEIPRKPKELSLQIIDNKDCKFEILKIEKPSKENEMLDIFKNEEKIKEEITKKEIKIVNPLEIYQNNDFTFEIINQKPIDKKYDEKISISKPDYNLNIENISFEIKDTILKEVSKKSRNKNTIINDDISFKGSQNSDDLNKIPLLFTENKTIYSSINQFTIFQKEKDKEEEDKIIIEKPEDYRKKERDYLLSTSALSINIIGKDITILKDESKDITKDISKDITHLSKEFHKDNKENISKSQVFDNDIVNYNDGNSLLIKSQTKDNELIESIPSFNKEVSLNKDNSFNFISQNKEMSFIKENDNEDEKSKSLEIKQDNSELGYTLDEPVKIQIQTSQEKDNTFDLKYTNSPVLGPTDDIENENENELSISKKFNKLILSDYLQKTPRDQLIDAPIDRDTFIPQFNEEIENENINKNKNVITYYSFELLKEDNDLDEENDLITLPKINIDDNKQHKLTDSVFTHNFFKRDKSINKSDKDKEKEALIKKLLPIKIVKIIKEKNNKLVLDKLLTLCPDLAKKKKLEKILKSIGNKIKKNYFEKWKIQTLMIKIKDDLIKETNQYDKSYTYQRRTRFMYQGVKREVDKRIEIIIDKKEKEIQTEKDNLINEKIKVEKKEDKKLEKEEINKIKEILPKNIIEKGEQITEKRIEGEPIKEIKVDDPTNNRKENRR
jgi:hypothetical protein